MVKIVQTKPRGAPTKLTLESIDFIASKLDRMTDIPQLAASIGVTAHTVRNWMRRGESSIEEPYRALFLAVMAKQAQQIEDLHRQAEAYAAMNNTAGTNWVKWKLAKFFPESYGEKIEKVSEDADDEDVTSMSTDELVKRAKRYIAGKTIDADPE